MIKAVIDTIDDGAVGEQRGEAAAAGLDEGFVTANVEVALVLPGETRLGQILGGCGTADGDGTARAAFSL